MENIITTQEGFNAELQALLARTDFSFGGIREHDDTGKKVKPGTPKHYFTANAVLSGADGMTIKGRQVFPSRIQVQINAQRLAGSKRAKAAEPAAASANWDALDEIANEAPTPGSLVVVAPPAHTV